MGPGTIILLVILVVMAAMVIIGMFDRRFNHALREVAKDKGLDYENHHFGHGSAHGAFNSHTVDIRSESHGEYDQFTVYAAPLPDVVPAKFSMHHDDFTVSDASDEARAVTVDHESFDAEFDVEAERPERARELVAPPEVRDALLELNDSMDAVAIEDGRLRTYCEGYVTSPSDHAQHLEIITAALDRLSTAWSSLDQPTPGRAEGSETSASDRQRDQSEGPEQTEHPEVPSGRW